jgi:hypothetical protein
LLIPKSISDLNQLITDQIEESISLEYKAADALQNTDSNKKEIAKDVSAMANSAGGVIIYGIKEFDETAKRHLPEKITPIKRTEYSKEWLEHVINSNISPKIEGLLIHVIPLDQSDEAAYVVEIPKSSTAHQNTKDQRYYRRYNFESVSMIDYEIRDIMNRRNHPIIRLKFKIIKETYEVDKNIKWINPSRNIGKPKEFRTRILLKIYPVNIGSIFAQYINYFVQIPENILAISELSNLSKPINGFVNYSGDNTHRDIILYRAVGSGEGSPEYGPSRFDPLLPKIIGRPRNLQLIDNPILDEHEISWEVCADNAPSRTGSIKLNEIPFMEKNDKDE